MADSMSFKFSGDIVEALDKLGAAAGESTLRAGGFAGAKLIRDEAQRNAPVISGVLKANIIVKRREEDSIGNTRQVYIVTIRKGKMNEEGDAYYGNSPKAQENDLEKSSHCRGCRVGNLPRTGPPIHAPSLGKPERLCH
jgi:hypothetical protein